MVDQEKAVFMIEELIEKIRIKLPIQNPLHSFVHNNILMMFEDKDFHAAVEEACQIYKATPYWPLHKYKERYFQNKITDDDLLKSIDHYLGKYRPIESLDILGISPREYFYRLMFSEISFNEEEVVHDLSSTRLWENCLKKMNGESTKLSRSKTYWRGKDYWEKYHNESFATNVHPLIIRIISSYLDQGQSFWPNPFTSEGLWTFFIYDVQTTGDFNDGWRKKLTEKVREYQNKKSDEVIQSELLKKGIPEIHWEKYLLDILFDLKGWAGMVSKLEIEPWQATVKSPSIKLVDYVAMILLIEASVDEYHSFNQSIELSMIHGREEKIELKNFQLSMALYQVTLSFRLNENWINNIPARDLIKIVDEIDNSVHKDLIRLWHEAYEHHFHRDALEAIFGHVKFPQERFSPYAQIYFCIDDREESIRRHLEEIDKGIETLGVVGFFGIDMKFSSVSNRRPIPQCPPVVSPSRVVHEIAKMDATNFDKWNFFHGMSDLNLYYHSRTLLRGFFFTLILGLISLIPMSIQVFFPQRSKQMAKKILSYFRKKPPTTIELERGSDNYGYTKLEMAKIVESIFKMTGSQKNHSPLILIVGHGSSSNNNPFKQAYGCGACGGNAGLPNTRAFVKMANDPEVRMELRKLSINIPDSTYFVGALHDTCTDDIFFMDENDVPESHKIYFHNLKENIHKAAKLNAFERCQRFSTFKENSPIEALNHVKERANDLAQPRPEYGHSSNALAIVAKRDLTKGLYMNRRAFLLSYDWETDHEGSALKQVVLGGIPVAVNINMDYYFSAVDNDNFGCGSKLPLNLTSLLGVMTGPQSDLRIGLARQMIEIHEPIRNLTIIEAPLDLVREVFTGHERLKNILFNHWMRLVVKDPKTDIWWIFSQNDFEKINFEKVSLKSFQTSMDLIINQIDDNFAEIKS